ncbi:MAG TPA: 2-oxo acid dehydrogenase subunit E2 [Terracidiphilus sp.]|jgi:2-oxoglutarate dehydrogenase E2 component (dihydrolipoamide succinyltransferase)|nr:2-oxo acid dehydrogenase subunit E2 [Terracidiphilus sp.]
MPIDIIMPQMGESIFEGTITKWLKKAGDPVAKDEPLFEISTDKVDAEIPSPVAGVLREIKFAEGETVQVNTVVAVLAENDEVSSLTQLAPSLAAPKAQSAPPQVVPQAAIEIVMPQMGESIFEGTITKWLKKPGDTVAKDEPLFEISTDKVDAEIPSPMDGVLIEIKIAEGATVEVNTVVALLGSAGAAVVATPAPQAQLAAPQVPAQPQLAPPQVVQERTGKLRSSPLVRRIAEENKIDLAYVPGTGSEGRITKEDILQYLTNHGAVDSASSGIAAAGAAKPQLAPPQVVAMTKMRAIIAERMLEAKRNIPHAHMVYKVDMTRVVRLRERERAGFEQRHGIKLTYMPFIAAAAIDALRKFPIVNASLEGANIHYHANINLGVAVALEWGLIVPVVRASESASFAALAKAINDLATRARAKKLLPDEVSGSTFTLTNAGVFGGEFGTPIINAPESAILAIGGLRKEPVVLTDAEGNDTIAIRSMQYYCLGFDHRIIDGADAGKFMTEFKQTLENWNQPTG